MAGERKTGQRAKNRIRIHKTGQRNHVISTHQSTMVAKKFILLLLLKIQTTIISIGRIVEMMILMQIMQPEAIGGRDLYITEAKSFFLYRVRVSNSGCYMT